jgi:chemotaxis response regulator CheB
VIGASIGGPQMVKRFLAGIKSDIPVAFVLAQHIGSNFISLLAKQLDQVTHLKVMPATEGHLLRHNEVVVAPTTERVTIDAEGYIRLRPMEFKSIYTPSIDTVMTDISVRYGSRTSTIVFSGMGNDGVRGAQLIASRGGKVWAQDSDSCVVSSMPESTRRAGIVGFSGEPEQLSEQITTYFETHTK